MASVRWGMSMVATDQLPRLLVINQMAGPHTWELAEALAARLGVVALLTGHPDTLKKKCTNRVLLYSSFPLDRTNSLRRIMSWFMFLAHTLIWLFRWPRSIPVLFFSNPPILCWLGYLMWIVRRQSYAVVVYDIYPDILIGLGQLSPQHPLARFWRWLNRRAYEHALVVNTLGEQMASCLEEQFDASKTRPARVTVNYLWVDTDWIKPRTKESNEFAVQYAPSDKVTVMYSGNMGNGHDIETMLEAAKLLQHCVEIHFMFVGSGPKWQLAMDALHGWNLKNVSVLPWQPEENLPYLLAAADISLVSIEKGLEGLIIPSKAIYAMAAGSAVVALSRSGSELTTWLQRYNVGVNVEPGDAVTLANEIRTLAKNFEQLQGYRERARRCAMKLFDYRTNVQTLVQHFEEILLLDCSSALDEPLNPSEH